MNTCIYSGTEFSTSSEEHILQNFLGARFTSSKIVCNEVQSTFGPTIDSKLEKSLAPIRNLLGTKGGRGNKGPTLKNLSTTDGKKVHLEPGGKPKFAAPRIEVKQIAGNKTQVHLELDSFAQLGWAIHELRKQVPNFSLDIESLRSIAKSVKRPLQKPVNIQLKFGGDDCFRGTLKSCFNLLGASFPDIALMQCFNNVRNYIYNGLGDSKDFIRWSLSTKPIEKPSLNRADNFIGIVSRGSRVEGIIQLFGVLIHPFCLSTDYSGKGLRLSYLVDPFRESNPAEQRDIEFNDGVIPDFKSQPFELNETVWCPMRLRMKRFGNVYSERADSMMIDEAIEAAIGPPDGKPITKEQVNTLSRNLCEIAINKIRDSNGASG